MTSTLGASRGVASGSPEPAATSSARPSLTRVLRAGTTPGRLWLLLVGLVALSLLWGAVAAWSVAQADSAATDMATASEPLSVDAQQIYRSLSDADATATTAFLAGGVAPRAARLRYAADLARVATDLQAATAAAGSPAVRSRLSVLSVNLPVYAGEVETARANNRLGLPLGAAYLREASTLMRATMLPAARDVYTMENAHLAAVGRQATRLPILAVAAAALIGVAFFLAQRRLARRTHRVLNAGLVIASVVGVASLLWLLTAFGVARGDLLNARDRGSAPVEAFARADIAALRARGDESLTLIARSGDDAFQQDFVSVRSQLGPGPGTLLGTAAAAAARGPGAGSAGAAKRDAPAWYSAHQRVRSLDNGGNYDGAVRLSIGSGANDSAALFARLDADLVGGIARDQAAFASGVRAGRGAFTGLEAGVIVASLVMAVACARGLTRRIAEYR